MTVLKSDNKWVEMKEFQREFAQVDCWVDLMEIAKVAMTVVATDNLMVEKMDAMMVDSQLTQDSSANSGSPNRRYPGTSILNQQPLTAN